MSAGKFHNLALKSDGSLVAWGLDAHGILDVPGGNQFVSIDAGQYHDLAIIPEPATLSLLAVGAVAMIRRRRK